VLVKKIMHENLMFADISEVSQEVGARLRKQLPECLVILNQGTPVGVIRKEGLYRLLSKVNPAASLGEIMEQIHEPVAETAAVDEVVRDLAEEGRSFSLVANREGEVTGCLSSEVLLAAAYTKVIEMDRILQAVSNGILVVDKHGIITFINQAAAQLFQLNAEKILGQHVSRVRKNTHLLEILRTGQGKANQKIQEGGRTIVARYLPIRAGSKLTGAAEILQDLSELEELSGQLEDIRNLKEELETVFNSSYDEIFVTDSQGITIRVNQAVYRNTGLKPEYFIGRSVEELEKEGYFYPSASKKCLETRSTVSVLSVTNIGKQLLTTASPVFDQKGNLVKVVCNVRDITELMHLKRRLEDAENLADNYRRELTRLNLNLKKVKIAEIIGISDAITEIKRLISKVANLDVTILVTGESGVGKGIVARAIHASGYRSSRPFVTINCGAIPENLIESELFGYEPGAFTGARREGKKGLVELADGGTLFLDEIAELPLNLQVKILAFLQDRKFMRVGGSKEHRVNVRIIAVTNKDLADLVEKGRFREDLYYRLNVVPIHIPPLRARREDIEPLIQHYLDKLNREYQTHKKLCDETTWLLVNYDWPGNVRELENILERLVVTSEGYEIRPEHLPDYIREGRPGGGKKPVVVTELCTLKEAVAEVEKQLLERALLRYRTTPKMARALGVNQSTVVRKLQRYFPKQKPRDSADAIHRGEFFA